LVLSIEIESGKIRGEPYRYRSHNQDRDCVITVLTPSITGELHLAASWLTRANDDLNFPLRLMTTAAFLINLVRQVIGEFWKVY